MAGRFAIILFMAMVSVAIGEIMYIDGSSNVATTSSSTDEDNRSHLPLSALFSQSDRYKCLLNQNEERCNKKDEETKIHYGPKFQKIHLALPRPEYTEVGYKENFIFNNRKMSIKTLSKTPQIFEVTNFLSDNETDLIMDMSREKGMKAAVSKDVNIQLPDDITQAVFDRWDEDFDGQLSINEISQITELNPYLLTKGDVSNIITEIDRDKNSYISYGELSNDGLKRFKKNLLTREVAKNELRIKNIEETWLWHDEDELLAYEDLLEDFHERRITAQQISCYGKKYGEFRRVKQITGVPTEMSEQTEPLQIQKHGEGAFASCQQDSNGVDSKPCCIYGGKNCRMCRYATIMIFLNDVEEGGELVFPLADNTTFSWQNLKEDTIKKCERFPNESVANLAIKPKRGNAVIWYNHITSPSTGWMGQMDPHSIAGSAPVRSGVRWTAKMWLNVIGDGVNELRPWKMGTNWLSKNNKNERIIEELRNDFFIEGEPYVHDYKKSYKQLALEETVSEEKETFHDGSVLRNKIEEIHMPVEVQNSIINSQNQINILNESNIRIDNKDNNTQDNNILIKTNEDSSNSQAIAAADAEIVEEEFAEQEKFDEVPLGPPKRPLDPQQTKGKIIENRLVRASLLLLEELERDELETIARSLHEKLQLACIPLIVTPFG